MDNSKKPFDWVSELKTRGFRIESDEIIQQCEGISRAFGWPNLNFLNKFEEFMLSKSSLKNSDNWNNITTEKISEFMMIVSCALEQNIKKSGSAVLSNASAETLHRLSMDMITTFGKISDDRKKLPSIIPLTKVKFYADQTLNPHISRAVMNNDSTTMKIISEQQPYLSMSITQEQTVAAISKRIDSMTAIAKQFLNYKNFIWLLPNVHSISDAIITGRIVEENGKLFIESSKTYGGGMSQLSLSLPKPPGYLNSDNTTENATEGGEISNIKNRTDLPLLFNGMFTIIKGSSLPGLVTVKEFISPPIAPLRKPTESLPPLRINVYRGHFFDDSKIIVMALDHIRRESPDVVIFLGPFTTNNFASVFDIESEITKYIIAVSMTSLHILLVPSPDDLFVLPVFPQASPGYVASTIDQDATPNLLSWVSNPVTISINNVDIMITSLDVNKILRTCALNGGDNPDDEKLLKTILTQRSILPVYPPPSKLTYEIANAAALTPDEGSCSSSTDISMAPHIIIYGGQVPYAGNIEGTTFVSPGSGCVSELYAAEIIVSGGIRVDLGKLESH